MRSFRDHHSLEEQRQPTQLASSTAVTSTNDETESSSVLAFLREFAFPGWSLNRDSNHNNHSNTDDDASPINMTRQYKPTTIADCTTRVKKHHTKHRTNDKHTDVLPVIATKSDQLQARSTPRSNGYSIESSISRTSRRVNGASSPPNNQHNTTIVIDDSSSEAELDNSNDDNDDDIQVNSRLSSSSNSRPTKSTISQNTWRDKHTPINRSTRTRTTTTAAALSPSTSPSDLNRTWRFVNTPSFSTVNNTRRLSTISNSSSIASSHTSISRLNEGRISKTPMPRSKRRGLFHRQSEQQRRQQLAEMIELQRRAFSRAESTTSSLKGKEALVEAGFDREGLLRYTQQVFSASSQLSSNASTQGSYSLQSSVNGYTSPALSTRSFRSGSISSTGTLNLSTLTITPRTRLTASISADKQTCADISQKIRQVLANKSKPPIQVSTPYFDRLHIRDTSLDTQVDKLRQQERKSNLPVLDDAMQKKIKWALTEAKGPIIAKFNITVNCHDIHTLRDRQWLNDEIINFYTQLLMERANNDEKRPKIHCYNTFFYSTLNDTGYTRVRRWTKRVDIFTKDFLIIPVHLGMHWCCAVVNFRKKRIEYYDSLFGSNRHCFTLLRDYLQKESLDKRKCEFNMDDWQDYEAKDIPGQANGYDCGVFACTFAEYASRAEPFDFTQKNMKHLRAVMVYEIVSGSLLERPPTSNL